MKHFSTQIIVQYRNCVARTDTIL